MTTRTYLATAGAIGIIIGIGYLLVPQWIGVLIWKISSPTEILFGRFIGAYILLWGLFSYLLRDASERAVERSVLLVSIIGHIITIALFLWAIAAAVSSAFGWANVVLSVLLGLGAGLCLRNTKY